jgi:hypothetical protein
MALPHTNTDIRQLKDKTCNSSLVLSAPDYSAMYYPVFIFTNADIYGLSFNPFCTSNRQCKSWGGNGMLQVLGHLHLAIAEVALNCVNYVKWMKIVQTVKQMLC